MSARLQPAHRLERRTLGAAALTAVALVVALVATPLRVTRLVATQLAVHVSGNHLVDGSGATIALHGVNRSGGEYACVQGFGPFDGPVDDTAVAAIASWTGVNAVRLGLNEDCWLGINGEPNAGYTAAQYQQAVVNFVNTLHAHGLYAILELHWNAPGTAKATYQTNLPDYDHSPAFWSSVATVFKNDPAAIFDLFNEPNDDGQHCGPVSPAACSSAARQDWWCLKNGTCVTSDNSGAFGSNWRVAGMDELIAAVRGAGATNVVMAGGLAFANDLSGWLQYEPSDPQGQLAASFHLYSFNPCNSMSCWSSNLPPIAAAVPLVAGETGDDCSTSFIATFWNYADQNGWSYLGWVWDTWGGCNDVLISDYSGTPSSGFGAGYKSHLAALAPLTPTSTATPTAKPPPSASPTPTATPRPTSPGPTPTPTPSATPAPTSSDGRLVGTSSVQPVQDSNSPGIAQAYAYTATSSGTIQSVVVYTVSGTDVTVGVYADSNGQPGVLLTSGSLSALAPNAWNAVAVPAAQVTAGTTYWLAILGVHGSFVYTDNNGFGTGGPAPMSAQSNLTALPQTWATGQSWPAGPAAIYASGALASSAPTPSPTPTPTPTATPTPTPSSTPTPSGSASSISVDASVTTKQLSPAWSISSPKFTTLAGGELVLVMVGTDGPGQGSEWISSVSGAGLTFHLVRRANTRLGDAEVWYAWAASPLSGVRITARRGNGAYGGMLEVVTLTGANPTTPVGASAAAAAASGAPQVTLVATGNGSLVFGAGNDWDSATSRTPASGNAMVSEFVDTAAGDDFWVQRSAGSCSAGTPITLADSAPTGDQWNLVAVEVLPA